MKNILVFTMIFALVPMAAAVISDECADADFVLDVGDIYVLGKDCNSPSKDRLATTISVSQAGFHNVKAYVNRGGPNVESSCAQDSENFYLEVNGKSGAESLDDGACTDTTTFEDFGEFFFFNGNNDLIMQHTGSCPPDESGNSVHISKFCIWYGDYPGCTNSNAINFNPLASR